jgi:hypothetical protein
MSERSDARRDLRATSESIGADADRLAGLEDAKRQLDPSDPRVTELSAEVASLSKEIEDKSQAELEISKKARAGGEESLPN